MDGESVIAELNRLGYRATIENGRVTITFDDQSSTNLPLSGK